ncbi:energy-coupling factor transporter transmembrane protein EcfT [Cellulomonas sp. JH27-2]|uniref:energy-coupling factor transporter transmembrane component T family protein n=1 Tax=Cellulomonas sp. JH27-2 TaxID=2774139 RepID=UPI0017846095|nr:energy-coupling factor transporter transmembrane protein EcfT [Cellulomonas sp. JH27-2]MBD8059087.1 energy-coupling factor transporter transmembrane protein EcfT [Cellulomonas sp. JH27-2]
MSGPLRPPWSGPLGLYHPGTSVVHRCPPGIKLVALAAAGLTITLVRGPVSAVVALVVALVVQAVARVPWHRTSRGLVGVLVTALLAGAFQWWSRGWQVGLEIAFDLVSLVLLATLVTATTRADALLEVLARAARPLRHVGLSPETFALACGLFLRAVPVLVQASLDARDAARARGLERDPRAVLAPAAVRMVAHAHATGDALAARGLGED